MYPPPPFRPKNAKTSSILSARSSNSKENINVNVAPTRKERATVVSRDSMFKRPQTKVDDSVGSIRPVIPKIVFSPSVRLGETSDGRRMPGFADERRLEFSAREDPQVQLLKSQLSRLETGLASVTRELSVQQAESAKAQRLQEEVTLWRDEAQKWRTECEKRNSLQIRKSNRHVETQTTEHAMILETASPAPQSSRLPVRRTNLILASQSSLDKGSSFEKRSNLISQVTIENGTASNLPVRRSNPTSKTSSDKITISTSQYSLSGRKSDQLIVVSARTSPDLSAAGQQARSLLDCLEDPELISMAEQCFDSLVDDEDISRDTCLELVPLVLSRFGTNLHCTLPKVICSRMLRSLTSSRFDGGTPVAPRLKRKDVMRFIRLVLEFIVAEDKAIPRGFN